MNPSPPLNPNYPYRSSDNYPSIQTPPQRQSYETYANGNPDQFAGIPNERDNEYPEVYREGYSGGQTCIILMAVLFFIFTIGGLVLYISKKFGGEKYPHN